MTVDIIDTWRDAPRITSLATFFERTASGRGGMPQLGQPEADLELLQDDLDCLVLWDVHRRLWGHFDRHYFASIPYRLEEECRLGAAILAYALRRWAQGTTCATVYTLGAGTGCLARTLARLGDGRIETLCCSPTASNGICFFAKQGSEHAHFYHGPFFELDAARYAADDDLHSFRDGFDVLLEDTTFQMYDRDRRKQLDFIVPRLRDGGVLVQVQKLLHEDTHIYGERERQKDEEFKARFFLNDQISHKKQEVLTRMDQLQVDLEATVSALKSSFRYSVITWNSGNFYTFASSNSRQSLLDFVSQMVKPAIPSEFCYEVLPAAKVDCDHDPVGPDLHWRPPKPVHARLA